MNYQKTYDSIVLNAKERLTEGYTEKHHIIPRSLGGSDDDTNLVDLTAREHYICHWLLYKIHKNSSMAHAWFMMSNTRKDKISGRKYEFSKKAKSEAMSGKNNPSVKYGAPRLGKSPSPETRQLISEKLKGKAREQVTCPHCGKTGGENLMHRYHFDNCKSLTGAKSHVRSGKTTDKARKALSDAHKGKPKEKVTCPHCGKTGGKNTMGRWHFDNCRQKL